MKIERLYLAIPLLAGLLNCCAISDNRPVFAQTGFADVSFNDFASQGDWAASGGTVRVGSPRGASDGSALEWKYPLGKDAVFIMSSAGLERMQGAESFTLRIRSDRAGELAFRLDHDDGAAFYTRFQVGESWGEVELTKEEIGHAWGFKSLDPNRVGRVYIVDLSGQDHGWKGERTVWMDSIHVRRPPLEQEQVIDAVPAAPAAEPLDLPASRTFYMGTTPWPYDFTPQAIEETYRMLGEHTDLVAHHLDDGVPWPESFDGTPFPAPVRENLDYRGKNLPGTKVYVAATPITIGRDGMAGQWGKDSHMPRPGSWQSKDFDDPEVITAYVNYCERLIEKFQPAFMAYGIEVNMLEAKNSRAWGRFTKMVPQVYQRLKAKHPDLPLFLSIHIDTFIEDPTGQREALQAILPYTDYMAVSTYPYGADNGPLPGRTYADPETLPSDWFRQIANLAPEKPFAVAETGFQAEDFISGGRVLVPGKESWQRDYVSWFLAEANALKAPMVVWFVPRDYDLLWKRLEKMGLPEVFKTWKDNGLKDGEGTSRPALGVWDTWLKLPRKAPVAASSGSLTRGELGRDPGQQGNER